MKQKRIWIVALVLALLLALLPAGAQATPPIAGQSISFGDGNDVGASTSGVNSAALGDLDNDGDLDIVSGSSFGEDFEVIAWQNDGTPYNDIWTQNDVGMVGTDVNSVAMGDLDNDGDLDIISADSGGDVTAWQNDGLPFSGLWTPNDVGASADAVLSVAVGDLDNDGDLDVVSGSWSGEDYEVIVWQNDGSPFSGPWTPNDVGASADAVLSVAVGDLDNDGFLDIVSGSRSDEDYEVIVWQNDGTPFSDPWTQNDVGASASWVYSVAVGDLDHDGDLDIVSGNRSGDVTAWENNGTPFGGLWTQNAVGDSITSAYSVAVGDLDNDGDLDVVSGRHIGDVIAWGNDGSPFSGLWAQNAVGDTDDGVSSVAAGDLDNDGDLDVVSGSFVGEDFEVIAWQNTLAHGDMSFGPAGNDVGASATSVTSVAAGDLDNDGDLDAVSGSAWKEDYEVIVWENDGSPFSGAWTQNDVGASADSVNSVALGDLDNDGDLDVVSGSDSDEDYEVIVWENDGSPFSGAWTQNNVGASTDHVHSVALGDLDHDGDLDIVSGSDSGEDYEVIAWRNDGSPFSGTWLQLNVGASADSVYSVALGDLDHDGDLDIVSGGDSAEDYELIAWQNDSTPFSGGTWGQHDVGTSADSVFSVAVGDLDHDGDLDIASGGGSGEDFEVIAWQNDGTPFSGFWTPNDVGASADSVYSVALGDLDHDGDLDVASGGGSDEDYEVIAWQNDGTPFSGTWTQHDVGASAASVYSVALGDLDHDGDLDIVSGSLSAEDFEIIAWQNIGGSTGPVHLPIILRNY